MPGGKAPQIRPTGAENAFSQQVLDAQAQIDTQKQTLDSYAGTIEATIDTFNQSKAEIAILKNNSGSSSQQVNYATTQVIHDKSPLPTILLALFIGYIFLGKGKIV